MRPEFMGSYFGLLAASMGLGKIIALAIAAPLAEASPRKPSGSTHVKSPSVWSRRKSCLEFLAGVQLSAYTA